MDSVLNAAEAIPNDANSALLIFDDLVTILNVDVNVTGMNADVAVSFLASVSQAQTVGTPADCVVCTQV